MIYLDNASTTRVSDEVFEAMKPWFCERYGNPGSLHGAGRRAAEAVSKARGQVAELFHCKPEQIVFASGGSEGNNMVVKGLREHLERTGLKHIVISSIEHESLLGAVEWLSKHGFDISFAEPDENGRITAGAVAEAIRLDTGFVSVMHTNNETGVINDIHEIGELCLERNILFHSDCVQAAGCSDLDVDELHVDFATISSHKIHGPKGVGAVFARNECIAPLIYGGADQEFGLRGGTENVPGIVGFGQACEVALESLQATSTCVTILKQEFVRTLFDSLPGDTAKEKGISFNENSHLSPGKILSVRADGIFGETLILMLDAMGIYISAGSACQSHATKPSRVLLACGLTEDEAKRSVRISFSALNTVEEVRQAAIAVAGCIETLRSSGMLHEESEDDTV